MSSSAARRKRAAPKARPQPQDVDAQPRAALSSVLTIAQAQDAAAALAVLPVSMNEEQRRDVGAQWNLRSRPVAVLGSPSMGCGRHVLPFLRRSVEGRALHATSRELSGACRQSRWAREVLHSVCGALWRCWVWGAAAECQSVPVQWLCGCFCVEP